MSVVLSLLFRFWKPLALGLALLALWLSIGALKHRYDEGKRDEGRAEVQAKFDEYVTAARERSLDAVGFSRRKRTGQGHYLEGDAINTNALNFSDVMRVAPGLRIVPGAGGRNVITSARDMNGCVTVWIDGSAWQQLEAGDIDDFVKPHELAAIEVYSATTTPGEFQGGRGGGCTTIVAWTKRRLDRKR